MRATCIVCGSSDFEQVLHQARVPGCTCAPLDRGKIGSEIVGELDIVMCKGCTHIFNRAVDPAVISRIYSENYSSGIPSTKAVFDRYHDILARAITKESCQGKIVLEIGASDFTFSELLLANGATKVVAFEPSDLFHSKNPDVIHVREYFSAGLVPADAGKIDLIVMRHVLEHMTEPVSIIKEISDTLEVGSRLYVEVPNVTDILEKKRIYDFFYEHINYFSPELLEKLLRLFGFEVLRSTGLVDGQHFGLLCRKTRRVGHVDVSKLKMAIPQRMEHLNGLRSHLSAFKQELAGIFESSKSIAIYGAGSHAIAVTNLLDLTSQDVRFMLDINKLKENKYTPLSHIVIRVPTEEIVQDVDTIVIIASLHQDEIHKHLRENYNFKGRIYGTYPALAELV